MSTHEYTFMFRGKYYSNPVIIRRLGRWPKLTDDEMKKIPWEHVHFVVGDEKEEGPFLYFRFPETFLSDRFPKLDAFWAMPVDVYPFHFIWENKVYTDPVFGWNTFGVDIPLQKEEIYTAIDRFPARGSHVAVHPTQNRDEFIFKLNPARFLSERVQLVTCFRATFVQEIRDRDF